MTLEEVIDIYATAWGEADPVRRLEILQSVLTHDATYTDPTVHTANHAALSGHIGRTLADLPGAKVVRISKVDQHHGKARFGWRMVKGDGTHFPPGLDIVELDAASGKLKSIFGFFGPLRELE